MNLKLISPVHALDVGEGIEGVGPFQQLSGGESIVQEQLGVLLSNIVTTMTVVGGLAFIIYFFIGSLKWITAGGDKAKVSDSQSQMTQAAIGLIAIVASYFIVGIVGAVLGFNILSPFETLFGNN